MLLRAALGAEATGAPQPAAAVLAPMVRLGTLPLRLLALERGARLVYTEEIVDAKLAAAEKCHDERLGTTDWRGAGGQCVLRTCAAEAGRLVVQLGTAGDTSTLLAAAAQLLGHQPVGADQVSHHGIVAVDINLGCPKRVAASGGSGGALFADREHCEAAVKALVEFLPPAIAVTCKVRLCADPAESLERYRGLAAAGAALICVHARRADERPRDRCRWAELSALQQGMAATGETVVLVANGDALDGGSAVELRAASGIATVAVARGALLAATGVFAVEEPEAAAGGDARGHAALTLCRRYCEIAIKVENSTLNTAFVMQWMIHAALQDDAARPSPSDAEILQAAAAELCTATTALAVAEAVGLGDYYRSDPARGEPAPPSHRYSADYFERLDLHQDWAAGPGRGAVAELRAANAAMDSKPELRRSNGDFRRLAMATTAASGSYGGGDTGASNQGKSTKRKRKKKERVDYKAVLLKQLRQSAGGNPRYFVLQQSAPEEKQLGYFAPAWQCKVVVGGVPHVGGWGKSKWLGEQKAAQAALLALPAQPDRGPDVEATEGAASGEAPAALAAPAALFKPRGVRSRLVKPPRA